MTELVANALDSGAGEVRFSIGFDPPRLVCADDGGGMGRVALERYHDIASTSKQRGRGIGFAGVGAKLSLLLCREVVTETRTRSFQGATRWWLQSPTLAPWEWTDPPGMLPFETGTAVVLYLEGLDSELLDAEFLRSVLRDHYESLLDPDIARFLFLYYPGGVKILVDGERLELEGTAPEESRAVGEVRRRRKAVGAVSLRVSPSPLPEQRRGLAVSVLGKVVKRGWEWLGLVPEHPEMVGGVVEVPELVSILTLNKSDFLRDAASLQRFYALRKRIQESVSAMLAELGELPGRRPRARDLRPVEREVGRVLDRILPEFPELEPLLERRRGWERLAGVVQGEGSGVAGGEGVVETEQPALPGIEPVNEEPGEEPDHSHEGPAEARKAEGPGDGTSGTARPGRRRKPGLRLAWVDEPERRDELAWLEGSLLALNRAHPAVGRVRGAAAERLLVVTGIGLALAAEIDAAHDPSRFVSEFLARWGDRGDSQTQDDQGSERT